MDASLSGWGEDWNQETNQVKWSTEEAKLPINLLEL